MDPSSLASGAARGHGHKPFLPGERELLGRISAVVTPRRAARSAARTPAGPAPMTTTSNSWGDDGTMAPIIGGIVAAVITPEGVRWTRLPALTCGAD